MDLLKEFLLERASFCGFSVNEWDEIMLNRKGHEINQMHHVENYAALPDGRFLEMQRATDKKGNQSLRLTELNEDGLPDGIESVIVSLRQPDQPAKRSWFAMEPAKETPDVKIGVTNVYENGKLTSTINEIHQSFINNGLHVLADAAWRYHDSEHAKQDAKFAYTPLCYISVPH